MATAPHRTSLARLRRAVVTVLVAIPGLAGATGPAPAAPPSPPKAGPPPGPEAASGARCSVATQSALTELSCEVARGLGSLGDGVSVAAGAAVSDRPVSRSAELAARIGAAVARALGGTPRVLPGEPALDAARAAAAGSKLLLRVVPEIRGGEVRLVADVHPIVPAALARTLALPQTPVARVTVSRRLDAELASFLPAVTLAADRLERVTTPSSDVVAVACGNLDANGALELVLVGRRKIQLTRVRQGALAPLAPLAEASWANLSPVAPSPLREPIASAVVLPGLGFDVGITDRASGFRLSTTLASPRALDAPIPWGPAGCLARSGVALGRPGPCTRGASALDVGDVDGVDAIAATTVVGRDGRARSIVAFRGAGDRAVTLRDDGGRTAHLAHAGAALALGDVDLDGDPDLVASVDTQNPTEDAIVVWSWGANGAVRERLRIAVPDGVRALAVCPPGSAGRAGIVAATATGLVIAR